MNFRDRPAERGATAAPQRPADPPDAAARSPHATADPAAWIDLYDRLSTDQRSRVLLLATDKPIPADQLPEPTSSARLLPRLLAGEVPDLPPLSSPPALDDLPAEFDPHQRDAVACILATPDLCLVQGLPGTGKSRVAAEAIARAVARGERVLVLAPGAAALDRLLELLDGRSGIIPLRLLDRDELLDALPPAAIRATLAARCRAIRDETLDRAQTQLAATLEQVRHREAEAAIYDHLADLAAQAEQLAARRGDVVARSAAEIPATAPAEADRLRREAASHEAAAAELRPLAQALDKGRWWTGIYWKAKFAGEPASRVAELEAKRDRALADAASAEAAARDAAAAQRRSGLDDEAAALAREEALVADKWTQALRQLLADSPRPDALTIETVQNARSNWEVRREADRREADAARTWADGLEPLLDTLPQRYAEAVNVVLATPASLAADRRFAEPFDLLLFDDAHFATRDDLDAATKRARRWALVGEPMAEAEALRLDRPPRGDRRVVKSPTRGAFQRLWQMLHCDPWQREGDRLICCLRPVPPAQRPFVACEAVADRPDIELRIVAPPGSDAQLAEVVFPPGSDVSAAKMYVFQELGEAPFRARADGPHWREDDSRIVLHLHGRCDAAVRTVELATGITELLAEVPNGWATCGLAFAKSTGWDRTRAEAWAAQHVGRHDAGRAIRLETPYRLGVGLGGFVADLIGAGPYRGEVPHAGAVEFVPVPSLPLDRNGHTNGHAPTRLGTDNRGGAGLETDLGDVRQRVMLPPELRDTLPPHGLVNLPEAKAVAKLLGQMEGAVALALTHAQAELIHKLAPSATVDVPSTWRQREAQTVIVSLVRSHTHRAVTYGDGPDWLPLALSRGRRLIIVGDAGTLVRRAQWDGPLEHLDPVAAKRERDLTAQLVKYLQGRGRYARAFHLTEGTFT
ncbi:MAG: AAA domain-containing protein [Gemmataceae bacterium]